MWAGAPTDWFRGAYLGLWAWRTHALVLLMWAWWTHGCCHRLESGLDSVGVQYTYTCSHGGLLPPPLRPPPCYRPDPHLFLPVCAEAESPTFINKQKKKGKPFRSGKDTRKVAQAIRQYLLAMLNKARQTQTAPGKHPFCGSDRCLST
jgi:hypothetical protein